MADQVNMLRECWNQTDPTFFSKKLYTRLDKTNTSLLYEATNFPWPKGSPIVLIERMINDGFKGCELSYRGVLGRGDMDLETKERLIKKMIDHRIPFDLTVYSDAASMKDIEQAKHFIEFFELVEPNPHPYTKVGVIEFSFEVHGLALFDFLLERGYLALDADMMLTSRHRTYAEKLKAMEYVPIEAKTRFNKLCAAHFYRNIPLNDATHKFVSTLLSMGFAPIVRFFGILLPDFYNHTEKPLADMRNFVCVWCLDNLPDLTPYNKDIQDYWRRRLSVYGNDVHIPYIIMEQHEKMLEGKGIYMAKVEKEKRDNQEYREVYGMSPKQAQQWVDWTKKNGTCRYWVKHRCWNTPKMHISDDNGLPRNIQGSCRYYHGKLTQ